MRLTKQPGWSEISEWLDGQEPHPVVDALAEIARSHLRGMRRSTATRKPDGVRTLTHKLDRIFSEYIRRRGITHGEDTVTCITCGRMASWKAVDCGHFVGRQHLRTRWDEKNCASQCKACNCFEEGNKAAFAKAIDRRWGAGTSDILQARGREPWRPQPYHLQELIDQYTKALRGLQEQPTLNTERR